ncbi:MAG: MotA/TolQ/ExbB proton channel family protein [Opitutales bacterium]|nr:MotA/TolQ/ExbB proton channel family protein [Opitutales bacterium]
MKKILSLGLLLALATTGLPAQSFQDAVRQAQQRLERAQQEQEALNTQISRERPGIAADLDELEQEVIRLRSEATNAQRIVQGVDVEVSQLQQQLRQIRENNNYIRSTLLNEYFRRLQVGINEAEIPLYNDKIRSTLELLEAEDRADDQTIFRAQLDLLNTSLDRLQRNIGGNAFDGQAVVEGGTIREGRFVLFGPVSYFAATDGSAAGVSVGMINNRAAIYSLPAFQSDIAATVTAGEGRLPIDATDGEAWETDRQTITLMEEIALGGMVMYPILGLLFLATIIAVFKAVELFSVKSAREKDISAILDLIREGKNDEALRYAKKVGGPVGDMLVAAVENAAEDKEVIEEILYERIINTQPRLERFLAFIAVTAATAPLLGLLGTVTGMIRTFKLITIVGTGDARNFAAGISEALITTKWGLMTAIPTLIMHALLNRKAKSVIASMEQAAVGFINGIEEMRNREQDAA